MRVPTCRRRHADADADMTTCCVACKSEPSEELRVALPRIGSPSSTSTLPQHARRVGTPGAWGIHLCIGKWFYGRNTTT